MLFIETLSPLFANQISKVSAISEYTFRATRLVAPGEEKDEELYSARCEERIGAPS
jgi:hypothetical protein